MKTFNIIVAVDQNNGIGKSGDLPWYLPTDLKYFKRVTTEVSAKGKCNAVIMGRKTWESIPDKYQPLVGRLNIVLTRQSDYLLPEGVEAADSLDTAFELIETKYADQIENVFVIGGAQIFDLAIQHPAVGKLYITEILEEFDCDTYFSEFRNNFTRTFFTSVHNENDITFFFAEYEGKEKI